MNRNARIGLVLFAVYTVVYGGFVVLNAVAPTSMDWSPWLGINLSIWYGFFLIGLAFALAMLYGWLCRIEVSKPEQRSS